MTDPLAADDWAGERGRLWRDHLGAMEAMLAPVDAAVIDALALDDATRVIDVGCGGGGFTRALAQALPAAGQAVGVDISADLIEAARAQNIGGRRPTFAVADAGAAPAPDGPADRLASRFGVMFFADPPAAFANLARWLRPGGRFAFAVWAAPADNPWMGVVRAAVETAIALPAPEPDAPGPFRYADAAAFTALLAGAGFRDIAVRDWRGAIALGGGLAPEPAAAFAVTAMPVAEALADAGPGARAAAQTALARALEAHVDAGVVRLPAAVHVATGTV